MIQSDPGYFLCIHCIPESKSVRIFVKSLVDIGSDEVLTPHRQGHPPAIPGGSGFGLLNFTSSHLENICHTCQSSQKWDQQSDLQFLTALGLKPSSWNCKVDPGTMSLYLLLLRILTKSQDSLKVLMKKFVCVAKGMFLLYIEAQQAI